MEYLGENINNEPDLINKPGQVEDLTFDRFTDNEVNKVNE